MKIKTTGIEQYAPGGEANIKMMVIGGPGVGKTRFSSFWPEPFYLNCEAGLASVADRNVPYVDIANDDEGTVSEKMLNAIKWLKNHPDAKRYGTVIVDTLDSYQRKLQQEWIDANNETAFSGYDAWGFLDAKMQALMTRLLDLDKNVIVLVHYKDKTVTEKQGSNSVERTVYSLQLKGEVKDSGFNDFDLVGWMDTFWKPDTDGERVEARGITFTRSPQRPFLKDRLHITPKWLEIDFSEDDYRNLFAAFVARLDELKEGGEIGEVVVMPDDSPIKGANVVGSLQGGALPPQDPREMPLGSLTKAELIDIAKQEKVEVKTSDLKADILKAIEAARAAAPAETPAEPARVSEEEKAALNQKYAEVAAEVSEADDSSASAPDDTSEPPPADVTPSTDAQPEPEVEAEPETPTEAEPEPEDPAEVIKGELGGEEISAEPAADDSTPEPAAQPAPQAADPNDPLAGKTCEVCNKGLTGENRDWVKLGYIKYRQYLCNDDYRAKKAG